MGSIRLLALAAACVAIGIGACARFRATDLFITQLDVAPQTIAAGVEVEIVAAVKNGGGAIRAPIETEIGLYVRESDIKPIVTAPLLVHSAGLRFGETVQFVRSFRAPETLGPGDYFICATADPRRQIAESNETNNRRCAKVTLLSDTDLKIAKLAVTPHEATPGEALRIVSAVTNVGRSTKAPVVVAVGLYARKTDRAPLERLREWTHAAGLEFGKTVQDDRSAATSAGRTPRAYFICAVADPDDHVAEANESNNRTCIPFTLLPDGSPPISVPDLVISRLNITPSAAAAGTWVDAAATVRNDGSATTNVRVAIEIALYRRETDSNALVSLATVRTPSVLAAGAARTESVRVRAPVGPAPGVYFICARADPANQILESDEANNRRCKQFTLLPVERPLPAPDLAVSEVEVAPTSSSSGSSGATVSVATSVRNGGGRATNTAVSIEIAFYARETDAAPLARLATVRTPSALGPGAVRVERAQVRTPAGLAPGVYFVCALADPTNEIPESDEANNRGCARFSLLPGGPQIPPTAADLTIDDILAEPSEAARGDRVNVSAAIRNNGRATGAPVLIEIGLYAREWDAAPVEAVASRQLSGGLESGEIVDVSARWQAPKKLAFGAYFICAVADPRNGIAETDETNNRRCARFALPGPTDFALEEISIAPSKAARGESIRLRSAVRNLGRATAAPVLVDVDLYTRETDAAARGALSHWEHVDGLKYDEVVRDDALLLTPARLSHGDYFACAIVDADERVGEADETNNRRCVRFSLQPVADLVVEKITPVGPAKASLKVLIKIRNAGVGPAAGPFKIKAFRPGRPRTPLLLTSCPLTDGQLSAGSPSGCPDLTFAGTLAADESAEIAGYFNYVEGSAGAFPAQPVTPGYTRPAQKKAVDFMVDGCLFPQDGAEVWCAVDEIDEINNFKGATLTVR